jgi:hypothetical protein
MNDRIDRSLVLSNIRRRSFDRAAGDGAFDLGVVEGPLHTVECATGLAVCE